MSHITHVFLSAWLTGAFLIISISSYYLLKGRYTDFAKKSIKVGLLVAFISTLLQLVSADDLARKVAKYNPEKLAALEGVYKTEDYTGAYAFGWVNSDEKKVYGLKVPGLLSFLIYRDFKTPVPGLDQYPEDHWPIVPAVFQVYHIMVILWGFMFAVAVVGVYCWWRNKWNIRPWILKFFIISVVFPQIANIAGWFTACMGRQPWTVYKLLKTKEAFSANVSEGELWGSLIMFVVLYLIFFALFLVLLDQKIKAGPTLHEEQLPYRDRYKDEEKKAHDSH